MPQIILNRKGLPLKHIIRGADDKPILLNLQEQNQADYEQGILNQKQGFGVNNALGAEINITTMTTVARKVVQQSYFEIAPAEYLPVIAGQGAWSTNLLTLREFNSADSFEAGIVNMAQANARLQEVNAAVDGVTLPVYNWATRATWTIMQIQIAARAGNWDYGEALQKARKKHFDLGIQRIAFLGAVGFNNSYNNCYGLLNLPNVYTDTSVFTAAGSVPIYQMSATYLNTFISNILQIFRTNCQRTAWPTDFYIPENDYIALANQFSPTFPIKTILQVLNDTFKESIPNGKFKGIKPISYAMAKSYSQGVLSTDCYVLLNNNDETLNMQLPVPFSTTVPNSIDNFQLQDVGYAQFTGVQALKPREIVYFTATDLIS
jgi:hypothetical protein